MRETTEFGVRYQEFADQNTLIVGISADAVDAQKTHAVTCHAGYPLLSDVGGALIKQLGIANDNGNAKRTTFVVNKAGAIATVFEAVKVDGHVDEVLAAVKAL